MIQKNLQRLPEKIIIRDRQQKRDGLKPSRSWQEISVDE